MAAPIEVHFFSGSKDLPPGEGTREIGQPNLTEWLKHVPNWRQRLSNLSCTTVFEWNGSREELSRWLPGGIRGFPEAGFPLIDGRPCAWNSIEHAFQALKIYLSHDGTDVSKTAALTDARRFMVGGDIVTGVDARKNRKLRKLTPVQLHERWSHAISTGVMASVSAAKYSQANSPDARILLATAPAQLWHIVPRRATSIRFTWLEEIRTILTAGPTHLDPT